MTKPKTKSAAVSEPEPERRAYRDGDRLLRLRPPARVADQASPPPGCAWEESDGGCSLVISDVVSYVGFINGRPPPGRHLHHRPQN